MTTFAEQLSNDIPVFLNTAEFAESATYTPSGGDAVDVTILRGDQDPNMMSDIAPGDEMKIQVQADEVDPQRKDIFIIGGDTWHYLETLKCESGLLELKISRSETRRV